MQIYAHIFIPFFCKDIAKATKGEEVVEKQNKQRYCYKIIGVSRDANARKIREA